MKRAVESVTPTSPAAMGRARRQSLRRLVARQAVPLLFLVLCVCGIAVARIQPIFLTSELLLRIARNALLVLALVIPILAGLGLNFGIVIGAMAAQMAVIMVVSIRSSVRGGGMM